MCFACCISVLVLYEEWHFPHALWCCLPFNPVSTDANVVELARTIWSLCMGHGCFVCHCHIVIKAYSSKCGLIYKWNHPAPCFSSALLKCAGSNYQLVDQRLVCKPCCLQGNFIFWSKKPKVTKFLWLDPHWFKKIKRMDFIFDYTDEKKDLPCLACSGVPVYINRLVISHHCTALCLLIFAIKEWIEILVLFNYMYIFFLCQCH